MEGGLEKNKSNTQALIKPPLAKVSYTYENQLFLKLGDNGPIQITGVNETLIHKHKFSPFLSFYLAALSGKTSKQISPTFFPQNFRILVYFTSLQKCRQFIVFIQSSLEHGGGGGSEN